jgi:hypothetical protein
VSRTVRRASALLLALSACFNPSGNNTGDEPASTGAATSTSASTSSPTTTSETSAASTGAVTTAPTGTTEVGPTTGDPSTTSSVTETTGDASSGTTGDDCPVRCQAPTPVCDPATLDCVECLSNDHCPGGAEPVCDLDTHTCRGCLRHDECSLACERDLGVCFPADAAVIPVKTEALCSPNACVELPCCTVADALTKAAGLQNKYVVINMSHGTADTDSAIINVNELTGDDRRFAILGPPTLGELQANVNAPLINFEKLDPNSMPLKTKLYLSHLRVSGAAGVRCSRAAQLWIDDSALVANGSGSGLRAYGCAVNVERTTIVGNAGGVEAHNGAVVGLINTIVGGSSSQPELLVTSSSTLFGVYVTVADQPAVDGSLISCPEALDVTLRNSIFVAGKNPNVPNPFLCDAPLHLNWSVVTPAGLINKGGNNLPIADPEAELPFKSWKGNDFLLDPGKPPGQITAAARWLVGDPETDINGTPRPNVDESFDYPGADIP